ncbi:ferredoxin reductase [Cohnella endophytica]|uniref:Ferredoxin reductase n=1 Tax=Cohnella endophytica TaxID=2419778 RepID=A0A494XGU7_9BACL|nr:FAD-dependent oxidoreductase [Cohnella endophytica]RKP48941.1 ferredoxin reductase [Cohnella endophytica]
MTEAGIVIVGAGEAGARAALELRECGWTGSITLIGKESRAPYERPPLSKSALVEESEPSPAFILDETKLDRLRIQLITDSKVSEIDRNGRNVLMEDGCRIPYHRLLLTTGASPRKLALEGSDTSGVLGLRSFGDALAIRSRLLPGKHIVVIGGGFIGLEVAASAREKGCEVTIVEVGPRILMRGVPLPIAEVVEARHRSAGVEFKLGIGLAKIELEGDRYAIILADGTVVRCDTIIAGIGAIPETSLAAACGLDIDNGIVVNDKLTTSDPHIYAAGDCCSFPHALYDGQRIRLEAWRNAQDQGIVAARNMAGASESYAAVPWFWSDQYDLTLQVAGLPDRAATMVRRESPDGGFQVYFHLAEDGRIVAASGIGRGGLAKEIRVAEMLIEREARPDPASLMNPEVKLKTLLAL